MISVKRHGDVPELIQCASRQDEINRIKKEVVRFCTQPVNAEKIADCQDMCKKNYGYRGVHIWLQKQGIYHNPKTVLRVMRKYG